MASINLHGGSLASLALKQAKNLTAAKGLPASKYNKLLVVCKQSRWTRYQKTGILMSDFVKQNYKEAL